MSGWDLKASGMTQDGEPVERYGWFAYNKDGGRSYFGGGSETPLPGAPVSPGPVHIRMFVDDVSGIGLWPAIHFPVSAALMAEVDAWVEDWTRHFQDPDFDEEEHDWRGHALSLRVQKDLGQDYLVEFRPRSSTVKEALALET